MNEFVKLFVIALVAGLATLALINTLNGDPLLVLSDIVMPMVLAAVLAMVLPRFRENRRS